MIKMPIQGIRKQAISIRKEALLHTHPPMGIALNTSIGIIQAVQSTMTMDANYTFI
jgi:hypothetical protein